MQALINQAELITFDRCVHITDFPQMGAPGVDRGRQVRPQGQAAFEYRSSSRCGLDMKHIKPVIQHSQAPIDARALGVLRELAGQLIELLGNVLAHIRTLSHDFPSDQAGAEYQGGLLIVAKTGHLHRFVDATGVRANCAVFFCQARLGEVKRLYGHLDSTLMG